MNGISVLSDLERIQSMLIEDSNYAWIEVEKAYCFYFCDHFFQIFKKKKQVIDVTVRQTLNGEIFVYCSNCRNRIISCLFNPDDFNTDDQMVEIKTILIQYFSCCGCDPIFFIRNFTTDLFDIA